jgi:hypothetical protein
MNHKKILLHISSCLTIILFVVLAYGSDDDDNSSNQDLPETIIIGNIEVLTKQYGTVPEEEARTIIARMGEGWRLPNEKELFLMYENSTSIGGFPIDSGYWYLEDYAFREGQTVAKWYHPSYDFIKGGYGYLRIVRDI